jgi:hypothetical protein
MVKVAWSKSHGQYCVVKTAVCVDMVFLSVRMVLDAGTVVVHQNKVMCTQLYHGVAVVAVGGHGRRGVHSCVQWRIHEHAFLTLQS